MSGLKAVSELYKPTYLIGAFLDVTAPLDVSFALFSYKDSELIMRYITASADPIMIVACCL